MSGVAVLEWRQPSAWHRSYELYAVDRMLGTLEFASAAGSRAIARTADGKIWSFKRTGFFRTQTTARLENSEENLAVYEPTWSATGGNLKLASGTNLKLQQTNFWATSWELRRASGEVLLSFRNQGTLRTGAQVQVAETLRDVPERDLLIWFVWYVLVLRMGDTVIVST